MAENGKKPPHFFICVAERTEAERKEKKRSYPVRVAGVWKGEKGQLKCGRFKLNVLVTRNTDIVLFENTAREVDETIPPPEDEDIPF